MGGTMKKNKKYLLYFISFLFITVPIIVRSSLDNQAAFGDWDTINETYPTILYTKRLILFFFQNLFQGQFKFPMIEYTLGMGEDVLGTLNWFGFGDPFYLLFIFFDDNYIPYVYTVVLYLKFALGGMAFILMCSKLDSDKSDAAYILGALVYSFTGFTLYCHWFIPFAHAMYCIPLMIYGTEIQMEDNRHGILYLTTFLFALSGYFFLYIGSIGLAVYVLYKMINKKLTFKICLKHILNLLIEYFLGIGLASIFLIPSIYSFLTSNRTGMVHLEHMFFSKELFLNLFRNIFVPQYNSSYQVLSLVSIGVICIIIFFFSSIYKKEKCNLLILLLLTTMPIVNCIMSGFGVAYDRWVILVLLYIAFLITQVWDELFKLKPIQKVAITVLLFILIYIGKRGKSDELIDNRRYYITVVSYFIIWITLLTINFLMKHFKQSWLKQLLTATFTVICVFSIHISWKENYLDLPISYAQPRDVATELIPNDNNFYRIDNAATYLTPGHYPNIAFLQNYNGIADYGSTPNVNLAKALNAWNVSSQISNKLVYRGVDNRAVLETVCSVKYLISNNKEEIKIPYGFQFVRMTSDGEWSLYKNTEFLPLLYGYETVTNSKENLDGYSIQSLIAQSASVDSSYDGSIKRIGSELLINNFISKTSIVQTDVVDGEEIGLEVDLLPDCENYILIKHVNNNNQFELYSDGNLVTKANASSDYNNNGYIGLNLGTVDAKTHKTYYLKVLNNDKIDVQKITYDYSNYHNVISKLRLDISELNVDTNYIKATVNMREPRMVCIAMPYSPGWTATVDGNECETYCINDMFIGVELTEGSHDLVLSYRTPGIRLSIFITLLSILGFISLILCNRAQK